MPMLTLNGTLQNVYMQHQSTDRKTGEIRPACLKAQILCENVTESGEKRLEMVTLKVHTDSYKNLIGKQIRVPVGAFAANGSIMFYALRNEAQTQAQAA